jgi:hypothetical protein
MTSTQHICGHAFAGTDIACSAADVGADAAGTATTAVNGAVNGTPGWVPYFSAAHTISSLAPYATGISATSVPITDGSGTLNPFITGATGSGNSVTVNGGRVTSVSAISYLSANGVSCSGADTINATNGQITGCTTTGLKAADFSGFGGVFTNSSPGYVDSSGTAWTTVYTATTASVPAGSHHIKVDAHTDFVHGGTGFICNFRLLFDSSMVIGNATSVSSGGIAGLTDYDGFSGGGTTHSVALQMQSDTGYCRVYSGTASISGLVLP